jgi:hypothetical protein
MQTDTNPIVPYKHGPAWLTWAPDLGQFALNPERAAVIREIFAKADEGWSIDRIARHLNERGEPTWGSGQRKPDFWRGSDIRKVLTNPPPLACWKCITPKKMKGRGKARQTRGHH